MTTDLSHAKKRSALKDLKNLILQSARKREILVLLLQETWSPKKELQEAEWLEKKVKESEPEQSSVSESSGLDGE